MPEVSVPSFGDSFFIRKARLAMANYNREFPSPHSGILFLSAINNEDINGVVSVSVPSFGDSFFITKRRSNGTADEVSVPSFGDSFFINRTTVRSLK